MTQQANVKVTERGGSYFTNKVQGKASSCTYSAEVAVASLAQKLFPGQQIAIDQVDKQNWTITMKGEFNQLSAAEALMVEALADFGKHNDPNRLNPNATPLKTRLVEIAQRVFGDASLRAVIASKKIERESDYHIALNRVRDLMNLPKMDKDTEADFETLVAQVQKYEDIHFPMLRTQK